MGDGRFQPKYSASEIENFLKRAASHSGEDCLIWPYRRLRSGYGRFSRGGGDQYAHRDVCERVHGKPQFAGAHAAHSCGKGKDGCVSGNHLRWATPTENAADKATHGTLLTGQKNHKAKLKPEQIGKILNDARSTREIAAEYGVSSANVQLIKRGEAWKHVTAHQVAVPSADPRRGELNCRAILTEAQVRAIYADTRSGPQVAAEHGTTTNNVWCIRTGKTWAWLTGHLCRSAA